MIDESRSKKIIEIDQKSLLVEALRKKAGVSNIRANISLVLIICFIAVGIYIFLDAGSIAVRELKPLGIKFQANWDEIESIEKPSKDAEKVLDDNG